MSDRKRIALNDTIRTGDGITGVVVKVGIGLGDSGEGTEIIKVNVAVPGEPDDVRNFFAAACEIVAAGEEARASGHEDGGTLNAAVKSDTTITRGGDTMPTGSTDDLSDDELDDLTDPEGH